MKKLVLIVLFACMIVAVLPISSIIKIMPVKAYSGILPSAWASNPPVIDGIIDVATEWVMADKETFTIDGSYSGTLYVMNDATNLYLAVKIADDDFGTDASTRDIVMFYFDNDHDGTGPEIGDECLACISNSTYFDQFFQSPSYAWDDLNSGTDDGVVASSGDGIYNYFEVSHPLNSTDDAHDFSLAVGDTVGFMIQYVDNNTYVGNWPAGASPFMSPTDWHEIKIASSIYQGDLILSDNDVYTITGNFDINGSIIVKDNATLILKDAVVNFTQTTYHQFNLTLEEPSNGNPKLEVSNATLTSNNMFSIYLYGNSTISADKLSAYEDIFFYDESSGNITNSQGLLTIYSYQSSNLQFINSEFVQMRMHDSSVLLFSGSNATNFIEAYEDSNITVLNSRIRVFGTYNSAQATVSNSTLTYFNDQGSNYASTVNMTDSTITDELRSWGASQLIFSNCTIGFSDIDSQSIITFKDCWLNGTHTRSSAVVSIKNQCITNGSIIVEENSTLILEQAIVNFTQVDNWQLNITLSNPVDGNPKLQAVNTTITSNFRYSIDLFDNSSAFIQNCQFEALPGYYCWLFLWSSSFASIYDSTIYALSSFTTSGISIFNSSINNMNVYVLANASVYNSNIDSMNTYGDAVISAEDSSILAAQTFDNSQQLVSDSAINLIHARNETSIFLINSTCSDFTLENQSQVFVHWYLDTHVVDSLYNNVPSANVTAIFPNATRAESKLTDASGWARLTLMEKIMNATGDYAIGNYSLEAKYLTYSNTTTVNMTGNQQITLTLEDFVIPDFQSFLILSMFMMATLLVVMVHKRKLHHTKTSFDV
jgi:uncharacterized protein (DUF1778 family)